jgi:hypothetical protein
MVKGEKVRKRKKIGEWKWEKESRRGDHHRKRNGEQRGKETNKGVKMRKRLWRILERKEKKIKGRGREERKDKEERKRRE